MKNYGMRIIEDDRVNLNLNGVSMSFLSMFSAADDALIGTEMWSDSKNQSPRIPPETLIIADSISNDLVIMDLSETNYGEIYFISNLKAWGLLRTMITWCCLRGHLPNFCQKLSITRTQQKLTSTSPMT